MCFRLGVWNPDQILSIFMARGTVTMVSKKPVPCWFGLMGMSRGEQPARRRTIRETVSGLLCCEVWVDNGA